MPVTTGASGATVVAMLPVAILAALIAAALWWLIRHRHERDRLWWLAWSVPLIGMIGIAVLVAGDLTLQKVVGQLLMPAGLVWLGLLLLTASAATAKQWRRLAVTLALTVLYTAAGNIWLGAALIRHLEASVPPRDIALEAPFDAVCVLGGGTMRDLAGRPQLGGSGDRIVHGARCFLAGKTPLLVTTGSGLAGEDRDIAAETRTLWLGLGIPDAAIVTVPGPAITRAEIIALHAMAQERGWNRVGLVSSAWHLPRALRHADAIGFAVTPLPCHSLGRSAPWWFLHLIPHHDGFERTHIAMWEWLGSLAGR